MTRLTKAKWLRKLLQARYFVVLTDRESVISLEGVKPEDFDDYLALQSQTAALQDFHSKLGELVKDHERAVEKLLVPKQRSKRVTSARSKPTVNRNAKVKKIKVREE